MGRSLMCGLRGYTLCDAKHNECPILNTRLCTNYSRLQEPPFANLCCKSLKDAQLEQIIIQVSIDVFSQKRS
ncbi:hypothetical protein K7X08_029178 [Anisodus acutangulus]|uniref:Uncharacterized protein n=1 Tax=Anisodus acutangulus TaxID=402998 RepID=A0A9Q1QUH1_9SOLA|nr:hypothetical protein K7X08_029178 [Anisodus acutangulus]